MTVSSRSNLRKQLEDLRQVISDSGIYLQEMHEKRFGTVKAHTTYPPITVPPLNVDIPSSFQTKVQSYGLSDYAHQVLSKSLNDLQTDYIQRFDDACQKICQTMVVPQLAGHLPSFIAKLRSVIQDDFQTRGLPKLLQRVEAFVNEHPSRSSPPPQTSQPHIAPYQPPVPFNNDYTPALEAYFAYDPYPSVKDRQTIASRTGMATRQIEVWFQNHRKRAREQGVVLPDKRSSGGFGDFSGEKERMLDLFNAKPTPTPATTTPSTSTSSSSSSFSFTSSPSPASTPSPTPTPSFSFSFSSSPAPSSVPSTPTAPTFPPSSSSIPHTNTKPPSVFPLSLGSGTGTTPDDPIHIDTSEMSMSMEREKERGMTITSAGNGVGVMELDDDVERVARRRERKKGEDGEKEREVREEMREQRNKLLSVIRPRIRYKRRPSTPNPLDTPTYASPTAFPTAFTPPPAELQFRNRVTPPSTSFPTLPHSPSPPKNPMTKQEYKETLKTTTSLLSSLSLSSPSPSPPSPPKPQTRIKSLMHAFGTGIDAATCAYTYVLPKAPFWASVSVQPPSRSQSQAQRKKPAALGPKRNPRNAPSASPSSASSSRTKPKAVVAKRHSPTPEPGLGGGGGGGLQRYSSQSSLASTSSSSSSSSSSSFTYSPPRTPPPSGPEHDSVHIFDPSPSSVFSSPFAFNPVPPTTNPSSSFSSFTSHPHPSSPSSFTTTPVTSSSSSSIPPGYPEGFVPFSQISSSTMSLPEYYTFATATKPNPKPPVSVSVSESESMGFDFQVNHHIQDMHAINAFVDGLM
ncbi:hypothetical protein F5880DRAFT_1615529 [Lentinula raphanica]|nr:hypothetical protein F5880DRAFT_1615529 [Lentinula raphanica]